MDIYLVAGLGNPGLKYHGTRHNAGFMVLDRFAELNRLTVDRKQFNAEYGQGDMNGSRLILIKPQTFMNLSGRSVSAAASYFKIAPENIIIIHDELDLPFGRIAIKKGGGHGGHNGLKSIIQETGSSDFIRIRIGIDKSPSKESADYVLSPFSKANQSELPTLLDLASGILESVINDGVQSAMNRYNKKEPKKESKSTSV